MNSQPATFPIVNPEIELYLDGLSQQATNKILVQMEIYAEKNRFPIVGRLVGPFLETMALTIGAKRIFEFGSGFGYSAAWFAKAVGNDGEVVCCEYDSEYCKSAKTYLERMGLWQRVRYHNQSAFEVFEKQSGKFDLIFCDADKEDYPIIFELAKTRLRKGGLYLADNVLWDGQVVENNEDNVDDWTAAIIRHNRMVFNDPEFKSFINPIRDGVLTAFKV